MDEATLTAATTEAAAPQQATVVEPERQPEITLSEDGEVAFSDSFFGGRDGGERERESEGESAPEPHPEPEPAIAGYTDDDLRDTPWEEWDPERISGDVKRYIPFMQEQLARRQAAAAQMQAVRMAQAQAPRQAAAGPAVLSQKEITEAAQKMARERLGLKEGEELDLYEPEHVAALSLAAQETRARNQYEIAQFRRVEAEQRQFGAFAADLASRSDFAEFDRWVTGRLATAGLRPEQLQDYVAQTGDIAGVQRTVTGWYQAWRQQRSAPAAPAAAAAPAGTKQAPRPPVVETGTGAAPERKVINLRDFGDMDEDDQARALMDAGLV